MMEASYTWARSPLAVDIEHVLECLEQAAPLRLITTPRMALVTCSVSNELYRVLDRPEHAHFDDLPVCAGDAIIGLLPRSRLARAAQVHIHTSRRDAALDIALKADLHR